MAHQRKLVRQAVAALLTNATAAGARVQATRIDPIGNTKLPFIAVYTPREEVDPELSTGEPRELTRQVQVEIAGFVAHTDAVPVDDAMDNLAEQIEAAMDADRHLSGEAAESVLESTETQVRAEDGRSDPLIGIVTLTYSVMYRTTPAIGTLDDFLRVKATHALTGGVEDTVPAIDEFTVQEPA